MSTRTYVEPIVKNCDERYKGYWIRHNAMTGDLWIEKDGFAITHPVPCEPQDRPAALSALRQTIDQLA